MEKFESALYLDFVARIIVGGTIVSMGFAAVSVAISAALKAI